MWSLMLSFLCCPVQAGTAAPAPSLSELAERIPAVIADPLADGWLMGLSVGLVRGEETFVGGYGQLEPGGPAPDEHTLYEIGSITKVFTSQLLAQEVIAGRLALEDTILASLPEGAAGNRRLRGIRWVDLSNHGSGLPRMPANFAPANPADPYVDYGEEQLVKFLGGLVPRGKPGAKHEYSNLGAAVLGYLIARRNETTYGELLRARILGPLGMERSGLAWAAGTRAKPFTVDLLPDHEWNFDVMAPAGGLRSDVVDLLKFARSSWQAPDEAWGRAMALSLTESTGGQPGLRMGLGWIRTGDGAFWWHNGQTGGYHSYLAVLPEQKLAVVVLGNCASEVIDGVGAAMMRLLRGEEIEPWRYPREAQVEEPRIQGLEGQYRMVDGTVLTVRAAGKRVDLEFPGPRTVRFYPSSENEFFCRLIPAQLAFERAADGSAAAMEFRQGALKERAERVGK
ncbi:MAG: serine hydrolase domain-containing protein [Planctomycetota bacterium]